MSRYLLSMFVLYMSFPITSLEARARRKDRVKCKTEKSCKALKNDCQCYCSGIAGFRDKKPDDKPVFVEDDPNGVGCYCKQWDLDNYPHAERPAGQE